MKRIILLASLVLGLAINVQAQIVGPDFTQYYPTINTPNTASFSKYGDIPISYNSGLPQIGVPFYTISTNSGLSLPIGISYHASGIKVSDIGGSVGLGWNLDIGAGISTKINGYPDKSVDNIFNLGLQINEVQDFMHSLEVPTCDALSTSTPSGRYYALAETVIDGQLDGEPDQYFYNIPGESGKFIEIKNRLEMIPKKAVKITPRGPGRYEIVDTRGVHYYFSAGNFTTSKTIDCAGANAFSATSPVAVIGAYKIDSIVTPRKEKINFSYRTNVYTYIASTSQTKQFKLNTQQHCRTIAPSDCKTEQRVTEFFIEDISFPQGAMHFTYSDQLPIAGNTERLDLPGTYALRKVEVFDFNNKAIKKVDLNYSYFGIPNTYRLKLDGVVIDQEQQYSFSYDETKTMPNRLSFQQDHWGYYNSQGTSLFNLSNFDSFKKSRAVDTSRTKTYSLKKITYPTGGATEFVLENNQRFIRGKHYEETTETFSIDSEEFPIGIGSKSYTLPNDQEPLIGFQLQWGDNCTDPNADPTEVTGNINLCLMSLYAKASNGDDVLVYKYPDGRNVNRDSISLKDKFRQQGYTNDISSRKFKLEVRALGDNCDCGMGMKWPNPKGILLGEDYNVPTGGLRIKEVKNYDENNTLVTRRRFSYDKQGTQESSLVGLRIPDYIRYRTNFTSDALNQQGITECNYRVITNHSVPVPGNYDPNDYGYVQVTETVLSTDQATHNGTTTYNYYNHYYNEYINIGTANVTTYQWMKGLMKNQEFYNSAGDMVRKVSNTYDFDNYFSSTSPFNNGIHNNVVATGIKIESAGQINCGDIGNTGGIGVSTAAFIKAFEIESYDYTSGWIKLHKTITEEYLPDPFVTEQQYEYSNKHLQVNNTSTVYKTGEQMETKVYYPDDVAALSGLSAYQRSIIKQLDSNHRYQIATPIQTETYKNGVKLNTQRTLLREFENAIISPDEILIAKSSDDLKKRFDFYDYDDHGNPLEISQENGAHTIYIWGYQDQYPIAKITNASYIGMPADVKNLISQIKTDANAENSLAKENELRELFSALRDHDYFKKSEITSYTYDPLIGVTSVTDPRGYTMTYHYDALNRLEQVKDQEGNILSENEYHYKNN